MVSLSLTMLSRIPASGSSVPWPTLTRESRLPPPLANLLKLDCRGNWGVDLQAGSEYGYRLLFIVLLSGISAVFLQVRTTLRAQLTWLIRGVTPLDPCFSPWLRDGPRYVIRPRVKA